jgi:hypothetical protein
MGVGCSQTPAGSPALEPLESRTLMSAVFPTIYEQLIVELINRARANPADEAARYALAGGINEGLPAGTISDAPKQPLAINPNITDAARQHSQWMIDTDTFQHPGPTPSMRGGDRMTAAGYALSVGTDVWGENIGWRGFPSSGINGVNAEILQRDLFKDYVTDYDSDPDIDLDVVGRTHRVAMMDPRYREVGVGLIGGEFIDSTGTYNALMLTQDFAINTANPFVTGVVFADVIVTDQFYTSGEGVGDVTITAKRVSDGSVAGTTTTWDAGGYSLQLAPGTYDLVASGGGLDGEITKHQIVVSDQNVKVDFIPGEAPVGPADLIGAIDANGITGPGAHPVPGDVLSVPVEITNIGGSLAKGAATVRFYLSTDAVFQADTDILMGEADAALNLRPSASKTIKGKVTIPSGAQDANYFILARIDSGPDIDESDETNNVAQTGGTIDVDWAFGSFSGRKNAKLILADASGDPVTFTLKGAGGGSVVRDDTGLVVTLSGTDETTSVTLTGPKGVEGATVASITGGTVKSLTLKDVDLDGSIDLAGAKTITLDDVAEQHTLTIGAGPAGSTVTIKADRVFDLGVTSDTPIKSITATEWLAPAGAPNQIAAPWVGSVKIKGDKARSIAGDFQARIVVTDASVKSSLGKLSVAGRASEGGVTSSGHIGSVTVGAMSNFTVAAGVKTVVAGVPEAPDAADDFDAFTIGTVNVKGLADGVDDVIGSNLWAQTIKKVTLRDIAEANGGAKFGVTAATLGTVARFENGVKFAGPADDDPNDDFVVRQV